MLDFIEPPDVMEVRDLGRVSYEDADEAQRAAHAAVVAGDGPECLLVLECEPVITVSRRANAQQHVLASDTELAEKGIAVCPTNRGGDVTYHGPGQLVVYPIVRLAPRRLNVGRYMRLLETAMVDALHTLGIAALIVDGCTGVWVDSERAMLNQLNADQAPAPTEHRACNTGLSKIAALGVRVSKNTTMHGIALNVDPDLDHFQTIVPCGLANRSVTSIARCVNTDAPRMHHVKRAVVASLVCRLGEELAKVESELEASPEPRSNPESAALPGTDDA